MDSRPFRPARGLAAAPGDENLPAYATKSTIHQRHKSTGTLQAAAKRTVFADRSNTSTYILPREKDNTTTKISTATQQSNAASIMIVANAKENEAPAPSKDTAARAVQQKGASNLPSMKNAAYIKPLPGSIDVHLPSKPAPPKRASTVVFNDTKSDAIVGAQPPNGSRLPHKDDLDLANADADCQADLAVIARKPRHHQSQPALSQNWRQQSLESNTLSSNTIQEDSVASPDATEPEDDVTEAAYLDAVEELPVDEQHDAEEWAESIFVPILALTGPDNHPEANDLPKANVGRIVEFTEPEVAHQAHYGEPADVSDYEDEEYYDDQGYTTAHSYRSRGDTTTGGIIMFPPKLTKKGAAELVAAKELVESKLTDEQIDEETWDISMVAEYGDDIFEYMKELEVTLQPNPHYMEIQTEIQWSMRSVLMDWVIQVHARFGLLPETLFLTVNYIDRFLSYKVVSLGKLQLVGATAIFVAAKYEEINCPSVQEIVYMVDGGYTIEEILKAERFMLSMLNFELGWPGPMSFLRRISKADDYDLETRTLAKYFLEVAIMDERFVASPPSYIASGAHCLARIMLGKGEWTLDHSHYSGYTYAQVKPLVGMLFDCCRVASHHHGAVFEKYSDKRYKRSSTFVQTEIHKGFELPFTYHYHCTLPLDLAGESTGLEDLGFASHSMRMPIPIQG